MKKIMQKIKDAFASKNKTERPFFDRSEIILSATCYLIFSDVMEVFGDGPITVFNDKQFAKWLAAPEGPPPPFALPVLIPVGVHVAQVRQVGGGMEADALGRMVILLPGGSVIGPPQVTGWRPRTMAENWAQDFDPLKNLFEGKEKTANEPRR